MPIDWYFGTNGVPFEWICRDSSCTGGFTLANCETFLPCITSNLADWKPFKKSIEYCLGEKIEGHCQLAYSIHLAIVVLLIGAGKTSLMLYIAFRFKERPLLTIGDAVASYLQRPDMYTQRACLVGRKEVQKEFQTGNIMGQRKQYVQKPVRRYRAASIMRMGVLVLA